MKSIARALETSVELPGVSESRPVAFPVSTPPTPEEPVFVYSPLRGEWIIGLFAEGRWFDCATAFAVLDAMVRQRRSSSRASQILAWREGHLGEPPVPRSGSGSFSRARARERCSNVVRR